MTRHAARLGAISAALLLLTNAAMAQEATTEPSGKTAGDFMVRVRALGVIPADNADIDPIGGDTDLSNTATPEIDISYFITDNIALELIAATTHHDVWAKNTDLGDVNLGDVWLLPPTLLLQYHFLSKGTVSPYVGAGINYMLFFEGKDQNGFTVDLEDGFGYALQAGADVALTGPWTLNIDVKKVWFDTEATVNGGALTSDVNLDPLVVSVGFGRKF